MPRHTKPLTFLMALFMTASGYAEPGVTVVPLWPESHAEIRGPQAVEITEDRGTAGAPDRRISNITRPDIEIYQADSPNGTGVLILPGGGYSYVVIDKEGRDIARWFNSIGVHAFVLKYRLPNTTGGRFGPEVPLRDAQRAMRLIRDNAVAWGVRADRTGVIGFSAGGHLAATLGTRFDTGNSGASDTVEREGCRPDFLMLGYPVISMDTTITHAGSREQLLGKSPSTDLVRRFSNEFHMSASTPPIFIFSATDDPGVPVENSRRFYDAARAAKISVEMHLFAQGGHGFGLRTNTRAGSSWPQLAESWLRERGLMDGIVSDPGK